MYLCTPCKVLLCMNTGRKSEMSINIQDDKDHQNDID